MKKEKKLRIAIERFQNNEITALKALKAANIPLTLFLDILLKEDINFHYTIKELREDTEDLL